MLKLEVAAAVIRRGKNILICNRPIDKPPQGWEFPGGKREKGETLNDALCRELQEELALEIIPLDQIGFERVTTERAIIDLHFIRCLISPNATPIAQEGQECKFVPIANILDYDMLKSDINISKFLQKTTIN